MLAYAKNYDEFCSDVNSGQIDKEIMHALNRDL